MKKPKLLFLVQLPPPVHGASMMNQYLVKSQELNNEYDITTVNLDFAESIADIGKISLKKVYRLSKVLSKLILVLFKTKFNLVYFTISPIGGAFYRDTLIVFILKLFRLNITYHLHGKGILENSRKKINKKLYQFVFNNSDVICLANSLVFDIAHVYKQKPHILPNGIKEIQLVKESQTNTTVTFIFLSNLVKSKGILIFLEALKTLSISTKNFNAKIVGNSGDYSIEEAKQYVLENKLFDRVQILGPKYGSEKYEQLQHSNVFVFPTNNDCFPLTILEAMQCGLSVVSTKQGAIPEIIEDSVNGFILKENSPNELAQILLAIIEGKVDLERIKKTNLAAFKEKYTLTIFEHNFRNLIAKILQSK